VTRGAGDRYTQRKSGVCPGRSLFWRGQGAFSGAMVAAMNDRWFYQELGLESGPVSENELRELIRNGVLIPDDLIRPADSNEWRPAALLLFGEILEVTEPAPPPEPPFAEEPAKEPAEDYADLSELVLADAGPLLPSDPVTAENADSVDAAPVGDSDDAADEEPQWYFESFGTLFGPVSTGTLVTMAREGELGPDDRVKCGAAGELIVAASLPGLFPDESIPLAEEVVGPREDERYSPPAATPQERLMPSRESLPVPCEPPARESPFVPSDVSPETKLATGRRTSQENHRSTPVAQAESEAIRSLWESATLSAAATAKAAPKAARPPGSMRRLLRRTGGRSVAVVLLVAACAGAYWGVQVQQRARFRNVYQEYAAIFDELKSARESPPKREEWSATSAQLRTRIEALSQEVRNPARGSAGSALERVPRLLHEMTEHVLPTEKGRRDGRGSPANRDLFAQAERHYNLCMKRAARVLGL